MYGGSVTDVHYVALTWNPVTQTVQRKASSALASYVDDIFREALPRLSDCIKKTCQHQAVLQIDSDQECDRNTTTTDECLFDREPEQEVKSPTSCVRTAGSYDSIEVDRVSYAISDKAAWMQWFRNSFCALQQVSCRVIAKEWIKTIQPQKQRRHPYNGRLPSVQKQKGQNLGRPAYWPHNVTYKEPDHILKEGQNFAIPLVGSETDSDSRSCDVVSTSYYEYTSSRDYADERCYLRKNNHCARPSVLAGSR